MKQVHVAVAVLERRNGDICIAKRADHQHQGGLWEFPGGKVEAHEGVSDALSREIFEELGVSVIAHKPLISVRYRYPDKEVYLDVHRVTEFSGEPHGKEGQPVIWCPKEKLANYDFPAANKGILNALLLPERVAIFSDLSQQRLNSVTDHHDSNSVILYIRDENKADHLDALSLLKDQGYFVTQKNDPLMCHLSATQLMELEERPDVIWLSASCHSEAEVLKANQLELDFMFISPVNFTPTHPEAVPLGWLEFERLAELAHAPVYALGGVSEVDFAKAKEHGAQGIAGIRAFF